MQPSFTQPAPADVEVQLGGAVNLTCGATGFPMPRVRWRPTKEDKEAMQSDMPQADDQVGSQWAASGQPVGSQWAAGLLSRRAQHHRCSALLPAQDDEDEEVNELMLVPEPVNAPGDGDEDDDDDSDGEERDEAAKGAPGLATLRLENIKEPVNYTCIASSALGVIHSTTRIKVQSKSTLSLTASTRVASPSCTFL